MASSAPLQVELEWLGDLKFSTRVGSRPPDQHPEPPPLVIDSAGAAGPSPVAALAAALAGCMAIDLVHILSRGRHPFTHVSARLQAERAETEPRRFVRVVLHFSIAGHPPREAVERALTLSRERYCSVWHTLRQDLDFQVMFELAD